MTTTHEVRVELLLGRKVVDAAGERVGRVEEIRARRIGDTCRVEEFHLGPDALLERFSAFPVVSYFLQLFGRKPRKPLRVPWEKFDLSDPDHPRLTVRRAELRQR